MKEIKMSELFEYAGTGTKIKGNETGKYPLISRSETDNGITSYTDDYKYDGNYITVAGDSSAPVFVQEGRFDVTVKVYVLKLLKKYEYLEQYLGCIAFIMRCQFKTKGYSYSNGINSQRLMNETISLPTIDGKINENLLNAYVYEMMLM